jgi:hypothetical protein
VTVAVQGREQIVEDAALAGLDLGDDRHAWGELKRFAVDDQPLLLEGDARGVDELVGTLDIGRLVAGGLRALAALLLRLRLVDRVARDALDPAVDQPVAGERKGVDLDLGLLALLDKPDILIGDGFRSTLGRSLQRCSWSGIPSVRLLKHVDARHRSSYQGDAAP